MSNLNTGANIDSDHALVTARLWMWTSNTNTARGKCQEIYDISKLQVYQTADCFSQKVTECLHWIPYSYEDTVNEEWKKC